MKAMRNTGRQLRLSNSPSTSVPVSSQAGEPVLCDSQFAVEARFYEKLPNRKIRCALCPRACLVRDGRRGHCGVRENRAGTLVSLVYSRVCAAHVDPIEKKPLFHYLPGTSAFSIATAGCNVHCRFCQNWDISQSMPEQIAAEYLPPQRVAELARRRGCPSIAFTYSEPTIFSEYAMDTADAAHEAGLRCLAVSNGYMQQQAVTQVYGRMDAVKIDLKAFSDSFYAKVVGGRLKPVLDTLLTLRSMGKWLEIVYLVIPSLNDSELEFRDLARWINQDLGPDVPLHFTQFHPDYRMRNLPVTPVATLERARCIAEAEGLNFVYIGNVPGHTAQNTWCPRCHKLLVERAGLGANKVFITHNGSCPGCQRILPGIWHV